MVNYKQTYFQNWPYNHPQLISRIKLVPKLKKSFKNAY
jgi:hypothetical protein